MGSIATVQTNIYHKNEIIVPTKFVELVGIFDKIVNSEN